MDNQGFDNNEGNVLPSSHRKRIEQEDPLRGSTFLAYDANTTYNVHQLDEHPKDKVELKRTVGLVGATALIVGTVIGSGIFVTPKGVFAGAGSIGLTLIVWVLCGFFSLMGALAYAELGTVVPKSGGAYLYFLDALAPNRRKEKSSWWREILPFIYQWQNVFFLKPASLAIQGLTAATYLVKLGVVNCELLERDEETVIKLLAVCIISVVCWVNCHSSKWSITVQNVFSTAKVLALCLIILGGIVQLANGKNGILDTGFQNTNLTYSGLSQAFYSGLWAYGGWDNLNYVTKEIKNPSKTLPRALIFSISLVTIIYTFTNVAYFSVLTREEITVSAAVAESFGMKLVGSGGAVVMILSVACSTSGSANGGLFQSGRLVHSAAQEGHMVDFLSYIHVDKMTPAPAILFSTAFSFLLIMLDIFTIINLTGFLEWIFMGLVMGTLFRFRYTKTDRENTTKVPLVVPAIVIVFSLFLVITPFIDNPQIGYFYILIFELIGVAVYTIFIYFEFRIPKVMGALRKGVQKLLRVVPSE